jgi:hypothetical protein
LGEVTNNISPRQIWNLDETTDKKITKTKEKKTKKKEESGDSAQLNPLAAI